MNIWNAVIVSVLMSFSANFIIYVSFGLVSMDDSLILGCIFLLLGRPGNFWWMPNIGNFTLFDAG